MFLPTSAVLTQPLPCLVLQWPPLTPLVSSRTSCPSTALRLSPPTLPMTSFPLPSRTTNPLSRRLSARCTEPRTPSSLHGLGRSSHHLVSSPLSPCSKDSQDAYTQAAEGGIVGFGGEGSSDGLTSRWHTQLVDLQQRDHRLSGFGGFVRAGHGLRGG